MVFDLCTILLIYALVNAQYILNFQKFSFNPLPPSWTHKLTLAKISIF